MPWLAPLRFSGGQSDNDSVTRFRIRRVTHTNGALDGRGRRAAARLRSYSISPPNGVIVVVMRTSFAAVGLALGTVVFGSSGCGGGSSGGSSASLDCAYLASDNCWKTTAAAASSCLPAESEIGMLSADGSTCTFATGDVVTFTPALVLPLPTATTPTWNFTVKTEQRRQLSRLPGRRQRSDHSDGPGADGERDHPGRSLDRAQLSGR